MTEHYFDRARIRYPADKELYGPDQLAPHLQDIFDAFPDLQISIDHIADIPYLEDIRDIAVSFAATHSGNGAYGPASLAHIYDGSFALESKRRLYTGRYYHLGRCRIAATNRNKAPPPMSDATLPMIDAHHHLWDLSVCNYPWLMARGERRFFGDPTPIQKNYLPQDLCRDMSDFDIVKSVHIQVGVADGDEVIETRWLQSCAEENGFPSAIVAFCDLTREDCDAILDAHQESTNFRGIRQIVSRSAEEDAKTGTAGLLENTKFAEGLNRLAKRKISFDLQLTPPILAHAAAFFCRHGATPLALCHAGSLQDFSPEGVIQWRNGLAALAQHDNVLCKVSGFGMFNHAAAWRYTGLRVACD